MSRVVHFEVPVRNSEAARKFYGNVLSWQFFRWEGPEEYWLITTGENETPGINGAFYTPDPEMSGTVNTVEVDNLDEALARVKANGGQMASPINRIPGVGILAYVKDPEGNTFGMMQRDPNAMM